MKKQKCDNCHKEFDSLEQEFAKPGTDGSKRRSVCSNCNKEIRAKLEKTE